MLIIRLRRTGKKNKPTYRLVVAEHSFPVDGKFTADLGFYNPHTKEAGLKKDDVLTWLGKGAQPSNSVARILEREKIKHALVVVVKKNKKPKFKSEKEAKPTPPAGGQVAPAAEAPEAEVTAPAEESAEATDNPPAGGTVAAAAEMAAEESAPADETTA